jgi:hypothetical protein
MVILFPNWFSFSGVHNMLWWCYSFHRLLIRRRLMMVYFSLYITIKYGDKHVIHSIWYDMLFCRLESMSSINVYRIQVVCPSAIKKICHLLLHAWPSPCKNPHQARTSATGGLCASCQDEAAPTLPAASTPTESASSATTFLQRQSLRPHSHSR